jgi:hypothetical protein
VISASSDCVQQCAPVRRIAALILGIIGFWAVYILVFKTRCIYAVFEVEFFRNAGISDILGLMNFGKYKRFSPLGFGLWGYLDIHLLVPLLGKAGQSDAALADAGRLLWFHLLFLGLLCTSVAFVSWKLFRDATATTIIVLLVGLNDAVPFQFRFASTLLCYQLQAITAFAIYFLVGVKKTATSFFGALGCIVAILLVWEQGLNLAIAVGAYLAIVILRDVRKGWGWPEWDAALLLATITAMIIYVVARIHGGAEESLSNNNEASYFFSYKNPLLMFDDLLLNFSGLIEQSIRQLFPFPFESFAVLLGKDMNALNPYNLTYSQFPNMSYRMMGLWFSGFCFLFFWLLLCATVFVARRRGLEKVALLAACIFVLGFALHLPVMHRDYFYIPGYAVGYKGSVSYVGFVFLIGLLLSGLDWSRGKWSIYGLAIKAPSLIYCYIAGSAVVRAIALTLPQRFPW